MKKTVLLVGTLTSKLNGSARSFVKVGKALHERGHKVVSVVPDCGGIYTESASLHDKVLVAEIVPVRRSIRALLLVPVSMVKFALIVAREKPDAVHINDIPWFYLILIAKMFGVRVSIHSRYVEPNPVISRFIKMFLHRAHRVLFVSEFNKKLWHYTDENGDVLNNPGIPVAEEDHDATEMVGDPYVLVVSRISPDKGILESIKLFYIISRSASNASLRLKVAGGCQYPYQEAYEEECREFAQSLGIADRIDWLGAVEHTASLYTGARAYIHLPNFEDPFPTTIMEALAFGTYIVTNRRGGIPEQVEGFQGVYILEREVMEELKLLGHKSLESGHLIGLIDLGVPATSSTSYGREGLYEERFSWTSFAERLERNVCL